MEIYRKTMEFAKSHPGLVFLVFYAIFSMLYKAQGSFMGDEATYSQIAKESLYDHSYLALHWKRDLWFEKPPLMIWLTALSFKLFGVSEIAAHIFPGFLALASAAILYFLAADIFKNKWAGFFAGFVFLTSPLIHLYSRVNMMDIPAGTFIALACFSVWKIFQGKGRWWIALGLATGLAVMAKSVVGFFPFALLALASLFGPLKNIFKRKDVLKGAICFLAVSAPWHIYMTARFGGRFWKDYLGFHIISRFFEPILPYPWEGNNPLAYFKLLGERSGIWIWLFIFLTLAVAFIFAGGAKKVNENASKLHKKKMETDFCSFAMKNKKGWVFLYIWFLAVFVPFLLARTKLPNYMVLAYYPFSVLAGGFLGYFFQKIKILPLFFLAAFSLLNFWPLFRWRASNFGEAHFLFPKILVRYFSFGDAALKVMSGAVFIAVVIFFLCFSKKQKYVGAFALAMVLGMNLLVPFAPLRNEFVKTFALEAGVWSKDKPINLHIIMNPDQYSFHCVGAYYLPFGSKIANLDKEKVRIVPKRNAEPDGMCFFEKDFLNEDILKEAVLRYDEGALVGCRIHSE